MLTGRSLRDTMTRKNIPFSPPDVGAGELKEIALALDSGWITTGPRVKHFEMSLEWYCQTGQIATDKDNTRPAHRMVCLSSATAALELNLRMLGIGPGDEVLVPAYTFTASVSPVIHCGAKPVFIDSQPGGDPLTHSPEMDYDAMERAITERTKAVIAVDLGGLVCDYDRIFAAVERKRDLFQPKEPDGTALGDLGARIQKGLGCAAIIADCAHALGAQRLVNHTGSGKLKTPEWKKTGRIAHFSSFSFHAVKNLTTAEGGVLTWRTIPGIDDEEIYHQLQLLSLHGQSKDALAKTKLGAWEYDIVGTWYKCNMTDVVAAIGLKQLERYPEMLTRRREIIERYDAAFKPLGVETLPHYTDDHQSSGHLYLTRVPGITAEQRNEIIIKMAELGVATNVHYKPLPMHTAYKKLGFDIKDFPNAYAQFANEITLPLHTCLTDEQVEYVIESYQTVLKDYI